MKNGVKIALIAGIALVLAAGAFFVWRVTTNNQNKSAFVWPVKVEDGKKINVERSYGNNGNPVTQKTTFHQGIDIALDTGTPVVAVQEGEVEQAEYYGGYGNCVMIKHSNGDVSVYGHLDNITVKRYQVIKQGVLIGYSGNTGMVIDNQLHFEIRKNGQNIDPETVLPKLANIDHVQPKPASVPEYVWPYDKMPYSKVDIISGFGNKMDEILKIPVFHTGVDIRLPENTQIEAIKSGTVTKAEWNGGYGLFVEIDHGDGIKSRYGHLSKLQVKKGDKVDMGQAIGLCGNTGKSLEPHLHFEIMKGKDYLDPMVFLNLKIK